MKAYILVTLLTFLSVSQAYLNGLKTLKTVPKLALCSKANDNKAVCKLYATNSEPSNFNLNSKRTVKQFVTHSLAFLTSQMLLSKALNQVANADSTGPIVVLGSSGKTGKLIVDELLAKKVTVRPTYRYVGNVPAPTNPYLQAPVAADVTKIETIGPAINGASTVIFAASASNKGGTAQQVDYQGVVNVAMECIRLKIPKLIVISSGALTRPDSLGFKFTNIFGGILSYKLQGENMLRQLYEERNDPKLSYIIVRPGGLLDGQPVGPSKIELNQGDTISGEVYRSDVADCIVNAALSDTIPHNIVFEIYEAGKSGPLESRFSPKSGYEVRGTEYNAMFQQLKSGEIKI